MKYVLTYFPLMGDLFAHPFLHNMVSIRTKATKFKNYLPCCHRVNPTLYNNVIQR